MVRNGPILIEVAQCAETIGKSIFRFLFIELWSFLYSKQPNFREICTITRNIIIGKLIFIGFRHYVPQSFLIHIQTITNFLTATSPRISCKDVSKERARLTVYGAIHSAPIPPSIRLPLYEVTLTDKTAKKKTGTG